MSDLSSPMKQTKPRRRALLAVVLVFLIGLSLAGIRVWHWLAPRTTEVLSSTELIDPRRAYDGPYRNIHPDVRYVGDAQCAACHDDIAQSYARHPMGRSFAAVESFLERKHAFPRGAWERQGPMNNPFNALGRRFEADLQNKRLWHRQAVLDESGKPVVELSEEVRWVIGSGAKAYAFLSERGGYVFQTPISWFAQKQRWDLSPGFGPASLAGRLVPTSCLFCHVNYVQQQPDHPDRLVRTEGDSQIASTRIQSIGCERCHGPGELHVQSADRWDIVNPARLTPQLREAVCEQCHLEGEARILRAGRKLFDYRPGLPLNDFWAVLVQGGQNGEDAKAVNHVEQMYQSKCFSRSVGSVQMGCTTCHDPHVHTAAAERQTYYRAKCLLCHDGAKEPPVCSEPLPRRKTISPQDSCIDCHMPSYRNSDIAHTASTDHRILRRPMAHPTAEADLENTALVDFYRRRFPEGDPHAERTLGLGLVKLMRTNMLAPPRHADRALRLLESALGRDPTDVAVRQGKADSYLLLHRPGEALSEAESLVSEQPENWQFLILAAFAAQGDGQLDRALDYWRRVVAINPFVADYQVQLVNILARAGRLDEARKHCEQLLRLDPFNVAGRQMWVGFLLGQGQREEARRAFDIIRQLKPPDLAQREEWLRQQLSSEPRP